LPEPPVPDTFLQYKQEYIRAHFIQSIDDIIQTETCTWLNLGPSKNLDDQEKLRELKRIQNGETEKGG
jgi:hypothetical protein